MSVWKQKATKGGGDFAPVPAGTHPAALAALVDIGTHEESFQGKSKDVRKLVLVWEVEAENARQYVARDYTLSFGEKSNLRQLVEKWRGKAFAEGEPFDLDALPGKPCLLSVSHKVAQGSGNTYARVDGASALVKGMAALKPTHPPLLWSVEDNDDALALAAEWLPYLRGRPLSEVVKDSAEWKGKVPAGVPDGDEMPF